MSKAIKSEFIITVAITGLLTTLEGINVVIEDGVTDEGDAWYAAGSSHLALGKEAHLFKDWQLVHTSPNLKDLCAKVLFSKV